jgi:hypothetical protein
MISKIEGRYRNWKKPCTGSNCFRIQAFWKQISCQIIASQVSTWRATEYEGSDFQAIAEILDHQIERESGGRRFLRASQI